MPTTDVPGPSRRLVLTAGGAALVLFASFPHRLEYLAHVLAGLGLAGLGLGAIGLSGGGADRGHEQPDRAARNVAGVLAAVVVAAALAEATFAGPPEVLDVANTVMGGLLGAAAVWGAPRRLGTGTAGDAHLALAGAAMVAVSMLVRYPVQQSVEHWWWFGS